jgi:hypothetical protein
VGGVELLDHLHTGSAVLPDLVDVGAFHQPEADVGMAKAVEGPSLPLAVDLEVLFLENSIEENVMPAREHLVGGVIVGNSIRLVSAVESGDALG